MNPTRRHWNGTVQAALGAALLTLAISAGDPVSAAAQETTFTFGGYVKFDAIASDFHNGTVDNTSVLRDIHFPGAIPVGGTNETFGTLDYHAKESRFNLGTRTALSNGKSVRSYFELDFLLAGQGDERVSNSYNPRLRHAFFEYDAWLLGQTWSTFMVLDIVEDLDFAGTAEGMVFVRQPQVRFTKGGFQAAIETSETTLTPWQAAGRQDSGNALSPDFVVRYNHSDDWGHVSAAGILRRLNHEFEDTDDVIHNETATGVGVTLGGLVNLGARDDVRFQATAGTGLGRYLALNFINGAQILADEALEPVPSFNGFVGVRHLWHEQWRSNANYSFFEADNSPSTSDSGVNESAWSASINVIYSPVPTLDFGVEFMHAERELRDGTSGSFERFQFSGKYAFSFSSESGG
jgi:hypothetical protein